MKLRYLNYVMENKKLQYQCQPYCSSILIEKSFKKAFDTLPQITKEALVLV